MSGKPKHLTTPLLPGTAVRSTQVVHFRSPCCGSSLAFYEPSRYCFPCCAPARSRLNVEPQPIATTKAWRRARSVVSSDSDGSEDEEEVPIYPNPTAPAVWRALWNDKPLILKPVEGDDDVGFKNETAILAHLSRPFWVGWLDSALYLMLPDKGKDLWGCIHRDTETIRHRQTGPFVVPRFQVLWGDDSPKDPSGLYNFAYRFLTDLKSIHDAGIIHRDLKPENVLVNTEGDVTVIDFDLAGKRGSSATGLGTNGYWPPEVLPGNSHGCSGDMYQAGCVLAEALTGKQFHRIVQSRHGLTQSKYATAMSAFRADIGLLDSSSVHAPMIQLIKQLLSQRPKDRPSCEAAMAQICKHMDWPVPSEAKEVPPHWGGTSIYGAFQSGGAGAPVSWAAGQGSNGEALES